MAFPELSTPRLRLSEIEAVHAPAIFDIFSNPAVIKYYGMDPFKSIDQAETIVRHFKMNYEAKKGMRWAILIGDEDTFVGTIGLNNLAIGSKKAELGFEIHPDYWRTGIASEAIRAVLTYAFKELELNRMGAVTFPANEASIGLLTKSGFQEEGTLRNYLFQNGQSHDAKIFSILQEEWTAV